MMKSYILLSFLISCCRSNFAVAIGYNVARKLSELIVLEISFFVDE